MKFVGAVVGFAGLCILAGGACGNSIVDLEGPDLGLVAHWALDESQPGSVVVDSSGFGLNGTPSSNPPGPTPDVPPVHFPDPYSLSFDGQDQWVVFDNPPILNLGGPISVAAWIRPAATDGYRDIVAHGYIPDESQELTLRINSGTYQFTYWNGVDHDGVATIPASDVGTWVHLCGVFDGSAYFLYRNGTLAGTSADTISPPANINALWSIGARAPEGDSASRFLSGEIDDVRIYGRALTETEVQGLYQR